MDSRTPIIATCALFSVQLCALAYAISLSDTSSSVLVCEIVVILILTAIVDAGYLRYVLRFLKQQSNAYEAEMSLQLDQALGEYHAAVEHENDATQELGRTLERELAQARVALASGDAQTVDDRLRSSLTLASAARTAPCENTIVAAVLANKTRQCKEAGVELKSEVTLPDGLPIDDVELASLFFNLIDNALHECEAIATESASAVAPTIEVRARVQAGQLFVEVSNPCRPDAMRRKEAAARQADATPLHGLGTGIVEEIARKHGGLTEFEEKDGIFVARAMVSISKRD